MADGPRRAGRTPVAFGSGILSGVLLLGLLRFAFATDPGPPHYHANWAVIIDGERLDLSAARYMEDVAACTGGEHVLPAERVHMHDGEHDVVHIHHHGVAWGHFLENLGFDAGPDYLFLDDGRRFLETDRRTVKYVVNGFAADEIGTRLIRSGDRLLISYGEESPDEVLTRQFPRVPDGAEAYNERQDPAGCAGAREIGAGERLRRAFWR